MPRGGQEYPIDRDNLRDNYTEIMKYKSLLMPPVFAEDPDDTFVVAVAKGLLAVEYVLIIQVSIRFHDLGIDSEHTVFEPFVIPCENHGCTCAVCGVPGTQGCRRRPWFCCASLKFSLIESYQ